MRRIRIQGSRALSMTEALVGSRRRVEDQLVWEMPVYPYPQKTTWDATQNTYLPVAGLRGGVERVAERFRPAAKE